MTDKIRKSLALAPLILAAACGTEEPKGSACYTEPTADPATVAVASPDDEAGGRVLPGSYIVAFRRLGGGPGLGFRTFAAEARAHGGFIVNEHGGDPRVRSIRFLTSLDLSRPENGDEPDGPDALDPGPVLRSLWLKPQSEPLVGALAQVDFTDPEAARAALAAWDESGLLWFAEPNYVSRVSQDTTTNLFGKYADDYAKLNYWWLSKIKLTDAYRSIADRPTDAAPTDQDLLTNRPLVAILDSGIDYEHPALKANIWVNTNPNAAGCKDDVHGCNTTTADHTTLGNGDVWPFDADGPGQSCIGKDNNCSHGTHVAGIVAADNAWADSQNRPAAGICPVCQIMVLKIVSKVGKDSGILDSSIIAAFKYVSRFERQGVKSVRVINASFGKFVRSRAVGLLIRLLKEKNDTLVVAAAGNEDTLTMEFPAAFKDAIAVAAVDSNLRKVAFSNFGRWVDVAAPGSSIISTVPGADMDGKSGTSMAAPMVAGVAGLLLARHPDLSYSELRSALIDSADPELYKSDFAGGYNFKCYYPLVDQDSVRQPLLGTGLLNANAAINRTPSQNLPLYSSLDRVRRGCSVVGSGSSGSAGSTWLLSLPIVLALGYSLQLSLAMLRKRRSSPSRLA